MKFILATLLICLFSTACKKDPYKGVSKLKLKEVKDISDWGKFPQTIKNALAGQFLLHLETSSSLDNEIILLDQYFEKQKSFINSHQIKDFIMLPDGRVLMSQFYYGNDENLVLLEADFATNSRFTLGLESPPLLHLADDGIIFISGNADFGTSKIVKYDFDFTEIWSRSLSGIRPYFSEYYAPSNTIYVVDKSFLLYEIDGETGVVNTSFNLSTEAWNMTRSGNYLYVFGYENDGTYCGDNLEILKIDLTGNEVWNVQLGRKEANDHVSDILVDNGYVYVSGGYGETNCLSNISSNYYDFYTAVISVDGELIGNKIENQKKDWITGSGKSIVKHDNGSVYILGITDFEDLTNKKAAIYRYKLN